MTFALSGCRHAIVSSLSLIIPTPTRHLDIAFFVRHAEGYALYMGVSQGD